MEDDPAARRLQRRPSIFFLTDESWVSIFCGVMISDRGMITYSNFIVGIPMSTGAFLPFLSFFSDDYLLPGFLGFDVPIGRCPARWMIDLLVVVFEQ